MLCQHPYTFIFSFRAQRWHACLQLCDGASSAEKERWQLKPPQEFHYLNQSTCYDLPRVSNADEYRVSQDLFCASKAVQGCKCGAAYIVLVLVHLDMAVSTHKILSDTRS